MSFLDALSCALGGVLLLLMYVSRTAAPDPPEPEPVPAPAPPVPVPSKKGFAIPIALGIAIEWDSEADIDLWISDPDPENTYVWYEERESAVGRLIRDEQGESRTRWEAYLTIDPHPGTYEAYVHYFDSDGPATDVTMSVEAFPGDPARHRQRVFDPVTLTDSDGRASPGLLLARFEIVQVGDEFEFRDLSP